MSLNTSLRPNAWLAGVRALLLFASCFGPVIAEAQVRVPGKVPGTFSVSPSGAATYQIPIDVPPGVAGMEPKLALNYSSQAGNGILGVGWSLEGLSAITRCPKTMATDGVRGSVKYDVGDRFCLDGQRLINVAGAYGAASSEYRTELESFSKVTAQGTANGSAANGPQSFTVRTKAGLTLEFGGTADSRIEAQGKSVVRVWALSRMRDAKGNVIDYSYTEDNANGDFYPSRIDYAANVNVPTVPTHSVRFIYEARPDAVPVYSLGSLTKSNLRLKSIQHAIGATVTGTMDVRYQVASGLARSRIASIQKCDGLLNCLAPSYGCYQSAAAVGTPAPAGATAPCGAWSAGKVYFPFLYQSVEDSWDLNGVEMPRVSTTHIYTGYADQSGVVRQFGDPTQVQVDIRQAGVLKQRKLTANEYPMTEALAVASRSALDARLTAALGEAWARIEQGGAVAQSLADARLCDEVGRRLMAAAERNGDFHLAADVVSRMHGERFELFVERLTRIVEPVLLMAVALMVGSIVVMMYLPVFDMATRLR